MIKPESVLQARRPVKLNVAVLLFQYGDAALKLLLLAGAESETDRGIQHRRAPPGPPLRPLPPGADPVPPPPPARAPRRRSAPPLPNPPPFHHPPPHRPH